ncbi:MAG TPA: METTL5 family protein [Candidatus Nanoarchaeia archaeon]|nr:METTL5 family protein [Candidatus Nanoarchaeia archaeon]
MVSKSQLAIRLSRLQVFAAPQAGQEQYSMDSEIAAEVLSFAALRQDIQGKVIADLGCGTGILGIGALLAGAQEAYFVDKDNDALQICKDNLADIPGKRHTIHADVREFNLPTDVVLQNPPFGVQRRHADQPFLLQAMRIAPVIYTFHMRESAQFIAKLAAQHGFIVTNILPFDIPLKATQKFHTKRIHRVQIACWRLEKKG